MARHVSESPVRHRQSPRRRSPSRREESSDLQSRSSRSPSPRTKRLRRAQGEREVGRSREREDEKHNSRGREKSSSREVERERDGEKEIRNRDRERSRDGEKEKTRDVRDREIGNQRRRETDERRAGTDERHSRGRHERSSSLSDRSHMQEVSNARGSDEEPTSEEDSIARMRATEEALAAKKKEEPSFELSGKLAEETNRYRGITLLFNEPPEAKKPSQRWRLYIFKDGEPLNEPLYLHRQSCYLFGRERRVADVPTDHPSCSKQHAVIQYREVEKEKPDGMMGKEVRPYIMDLGSTNKTYINESAIEPQRYYELFEKDTIKFGNSSREYVLLHENSAE